MSQVPKNISRSYILVGTSIIIASCVIMGAYIVDRYWLQSPSIQPLSNLDSIEYRSRVDQFYKEYVIWTIVQNQETFEWNLRSTKVLFWLSIFISVSGVTFSFWQFIDASEKDKFSGQADELELRTRLATIAFKSRSIAALVLFVSIAYLLVYATLIYPIQFLPQSVVLSDGEISLQSRPQDGEEPSEPQIRRIENDEFIENR